MFSCSSLTITPAAWLDVTEDLKNDIEKDLEKEVTEDVEEVWKRKTQELLAEINAKIENNEIGEAHTPEKSHNIFLDYLKHNDFDTQSVWLREFQNAVSSAAEKAACLTFCCERKERVNRIIYGDRIMWRRICLVLGTLLMGLIALDAWPLFFIDATTVGWTNLIEVMENYGWNTTRSDSPVFHEIVTEYGDTVKLQGTITCVNFVLFFISMMSDLMTPVLKKNEDPESNKCGTPRSFLWFSRAFAIAGAIGVLGTLFVGFQKNYVQKLNLHEVLSQCGSKFCDEMTKQTRMGFSAALFAQSATVFLPILISIPWTLGRIAFFLAEDNIAETRELSNSLMFGGLATILRLTILPVTFLYLYNDAEIKVSHLVLWYLLFISCAFSVLILIVKYDKFCSCCTKGRTIFIPILVFGIAIPLFIMGVIFESSFFDKNNDINKYPLDLYFVSLPWLWVVLFGCVCFFSLLFGVFKVTKRNTLWYVFWGWCAFLLPLLKIICVCLSTENDVYTIPKLMSTLVIKMFGPKNWPDTLSEFVISDVVISDLFYFTMILDDDERKSGKDDGHMSIDTIYDLDDSMEEKIKLLVKHGHIKEDLKNDKNSHFYQLYTTTILKSIDKKNLRCMKIDYEINNVNGDGNCLYNAVLQASKAKGLEPGISDVKSANELRKLMIETIDNHENVTMRKIAGSGLISLKTLNTEIRKRIELGIGQDKISREAWGGEPEIYLIEVMFQIRIKIISDNGIQFGRNFQNADKNVIVLYYVNNNHYMWLSEKDTSQNTGRK
eukprot:g1617.t1